MAKQNLDQEVVDTLFESVIEMTTNEDSQTIADTFYEKNPEVINNKLNISTKEQFISYLEKTKSMNMKMAEYAIDKIVNSIFKIARGFNRSEAEKFIRNYLNSDYRIKHG